MGDEVNCSTCDDDSVGVIWKKCRVRSACRRLSFLWGFSAGPRPRVAAFEKVASG